MAPAICDTSPKIEKPRRADTSSHGMCDLLIFGAAEFGITAAPLFTLGISYPPG